MPERPLDETAVIAVATAAGLNIAVEQFRSDVIGAAKAAMQARSGYSLPKDPASEPWPPMRTGGAA